MGTRVLLARSLGPEGMGLLAMVQPVVLFAVTLVTAGIPVAMAKVVAERVARAPDRVEEVRHVSLRLVALTSGAGMVLLFVSARWLSSHVLSDARSFLPLVALVPLLGVVSLSAVLRGDFQGRQMMLPPAAAQVAEQMVRVVLLLAILPLLRGRAVALATAAAALTTVLGETAQLVVLWFWPLRRRRPRPARKEDLLATLWEVLAVSLPVTASRLAGSLTEILDAVLIPRRLEASGFTRAEATGFFGNLYGMAMPLLYFPTVFTFALAQTLVPAVSEAKARGDLGLLRRRSGQAISLAALLSFPVSAVFLLFGHRLGLLFYGDATVGALLEPLSLTAPFLYLEVTVSAILRGLGYASEATLNGLYGSALRLLLVLILTELPHFGSTAVILAISSDLVLSFFLNFRLLTHVVRMPLDIANWFARPFVAALLMAVAVGPLGRLFDSFGTPPWQGTILALVAGVLLYLLTLRTLGVRLKEIGRP